MLMNAIIVIILTVLTTGLHAMGMILAVHISNLKIDIKGISRINKILYLPWFRLSGIILLMFVVSVVEVVLWASSYKALGAFDSFEPAIYFSMVTFTTLGYGEIVLDSGLRILASCEAAIGIIMFGWTTAIVIACVQRFYFNQNPVPELQIKSKKHSGKNHSNNF